MCIYIYIYIYIWVSAEIGRVKYGSRPRPPEAARAAQTEDVPKMPVYGIGGKWYVIYTKDLGRLRAPPLPTPSPFAWERWRVRGRRYLGICGAFLGTYCRGILVSPGMHLSVYRKGG